MADEFGAFWHRASIDRFLETTLPRLLAHHLSIGGCAHAGEGQITVAAGGQIASFALPYPRPDGRFEIEGTPLVVVPRASEEDLSVATIRCVGDLWAQDIEKRLALWHQETIPPLDAWAVAFFAIEAQPLDQTNPLAARAHLRRLWVEGTVTGWHARHRGRVCFIETPEGPNVARVWSIARGARIEDGRLLPGDPAPEWALGISGSCLPFPEHSETARLLMGANMLRQWLPAPSAEPPLVRTGLEPDEGAALGGVNLRTAYVPFGPLTHEDALVISEGAAAKLGCQIGDKLSNRSGTKGIVSAILPETQMPDGTEIVCTFFGLPSRMNFSQLFEAAWARVARAEGKPVIVAPFAAGGRAALRQRLTDNGLPEADHGWVYWGKTVHLAQEKLRMGAETVAAPEYRALRALGGHNLLHEWFGGRRFLKLTERLAAAGLAVRRDSRGVSFGFVPPAGETLILAQPINDPWRTGRLITCVGRVPDEPALARLEEVNARVVRTQAAGAPASLRERALVDLGDALADYFDALVAPETLHPSAIIARSGRAVLAPGDTLAIDQIGLPTAIVAQLFGSGPIPEEALALAGTRLAGVGGRSLVALRPVALPAGEAAIRIHPLLCGLLDVDFDGDQLAVYAVETEAAREEMAQKLTVEAHLRRDPALRGEGPLTINRLHGALFGLAGLGQSEEGRRRLSEALGADWLPERLFDRTALAAAMDAACETSGITAILALLERLLALGFQAATEMAPTMTPFLGENLALPDPPLGDELGEWRMHCAMVQERVAAAMTRGQLDPLGLSVRCGARGRPTHLTRTVACWDPDGTRLPIRHGWLEGVDLDEAIEIAADSHRTLRRWHDEGRDAPDDSFQPQGVGVLTRAMRSERPGLVLAQAAVTGEIDPLTELDAQLLVGEE